MRRQPRSMIAGSSCVAPAPARAEIPAASRSASAPPLGAAPCNLVKLGERATADGLISLGTTQHLIPQPHSLNAARSSRLADHPHQLLGIHRAPTPSRLRQQTTNNIATRQPLGRCDEIQLPQGTIRYADLDRGHGPASVLRPVVHDPASRRARRVTSLVRRCWSGVGPWVGRGRSWPSSAAAPQVDVNVRFAPKATTSKEASTFEPLS